MIVGAAVVFLGVAVALGLHFWQSGRGSVPAPAVVSSGPAANVPASMTISDKSIAVLPFTDLSGKHDQEYFADGIAEEVLNRLATVPGLRLVGRTSSFRFRGNDIDPVSVGSKLGVTYLLEGSVRREDRRARVSAALLHAKSGAQIWSNRFDTDVVDVLKVQDTMASEIARALQIAVEGQSLRGVSLRSPEALDAYLHGLQSLDGGTQEGCQTAVAEFQRVLDMDPNFGPAAIGLMRAYAFIGQEAWEPPKIAFERARAAAQLALRLEPQDPKPHYTLADIHMAHDWDWNGAASELDKAFSLGPREAYGVQIASLLAAAFGKWGEAQQLAFEAIALDPLDAAAYGSLGWAVYLRTDRLIEAEKTLRHSLEITPTWGNGRYFLGEALLLQGKYADALTEFQQETLDDGQLEGSAMVHFAERRKAESDARLAEAIRHNGASWPSEIARVYAFRDEKDHAFEWLEKAYQMRDEDLYFIKGDPLFKNIEADARFKAFLGKMNLPE